MSEEHSGQPRALIVGAAGQVGTQMVQQLGGSRALASGRTMDPPPHLPGAWLQVDLADLARAPARAAELLESHSLNAVFCVAGATDVERCEKEPEWAYAVNTHGPAALAAGCPRAVPFVYFSTEYVFDGKDGPYTEERATAALSVYGRSKLEGEHAVLRVRPDALILRTTVVYGPDPAGKNFLYFLRRQLSAGLRTRIVTDQISTPTSNDDLAAAAIELVHLKAQGVFHVCGPDVLSRYEFAQRAATVLGLDPALLDPITTDSLQQRAPRPLAAGLLTDKLRAMLGSSLMKNTEQGVAAWQKSVAVPL